MSEYRFKEVYFDNFCAKCKHKDKEETDEPCSTCLGNPVAEFSHKPVMFIENEEPKKKGHDS